MNLFKYSDDNKRYHTFNYYLKNKYQSKVAKVSLNAGFTCPNRDGTKGTGGCIFCSSTGSGDFAGNIQDSLEIQFSNVSLLLQKKSKLVSNHLSIKKMWLQSASQLVQTAWKPMF